MLVVQTTTPIGESQTEAATAAARRVAAATREEPGVLGYDAARTVDGDPALVFVERYEDADAARAHQETEHYAEFVDAVCEFADGEMTTHQYEVETHHTATFTTAALRDATCGGCERYVSSSVGTPQRLPSSSMRFSRRYRTRQRFASSRKSASRTSSASPSATRSTIDSICSFSLGVNSNS